MFFIIQPNKGFFGLVFLILIFILVVFTKVIGQTEKETIEKIRVQMKLEKYNEARALLDKARAEYPESIDIANLTVGLYERMGTGQEEILECNPESLGESMHSIPP
jgi:thioredoxin-like negative regulator of GroEL